MTLNDFSAPLHQLILFFFTWKSAEVDHGLQFFHLLAESGGLALEPSRDSKWGWGDKPQPTRFWLKKMQGEYGLIYYNYIILYIYNKNL